MATVIVHSVDDIDRVEPAAPRAELDRRVAPGRTLTLAGVASLAAGTVHAGAIAGHSEHRRVVFAFVALAVVQLAWGAAALSRSRPPSEATGSKLTGSALAGLGLGTGLVAFVGWVWTKTAGIPFVEGIDRAEPVRLADALAAGLALVVVASATKALVARPLVLPRPVAVGVVLAIAALTVPGTLAAIDHPHSGGHTLPDGTAQVASAVPPRAFDPALPIDLGGVDGVSPQQQARAENLLAATVLRLPQWSDAEYALANGFRSIGDGFTGTEHLLNPAFVADATLLDPDAPESLVFDTSGGGRRLVAAMYMMPPGSTFDDVPDIGGALTQWHIHDNLCFNAEGRVAGLTPAGAACAAPLVQGPQVPMIHVWIEPHPCGPFAALEGIAGGQVRAGEAIACDALHGG